jgi:hypothetical protein
MRRRRNPTGGLTCAAFICDRSSPANSATSRSSSHVFWFRIRSVHLPVLRQAGQAVACSGSDSISSPASSATSRSASHVFWFRFDQFTCQICDKQVRQSRVLVPIRSFHLPVLRQAGQPVTCSGSDSISSPASSAKSRSASHVFWFRFDQFTCQICDKQVRQSRVLVPIRSFHLPVLRQAGQAVTCSGLGFNQFTCHFCDKQVKQSRVLVQVSISSPVSSATSRSSSHVFWLRIRSVHLSFLRQAGQAVMCSGLGFDQFTCQFCDKQVKQPRVLV